MRIKSPQCMYTRTLTICHLERNWTLILPVLGIFRLPRVSTTGVCSSFVLSLVPTPSRTRKDSRRRPSYRPRLPERRWAGYLRGWSALSRKPNRVRIRPRGAVAASMPSIHRHACTARDCVGAGNVLNYCTSKSEALHETRVRFGHNYRWFLNN